MKNVVTEDLFRLIEEFYAEADVLWKVRAEIRSDFVGGVRALGEFFAHSSMTSFGVWSRDDRRHQLADEDSDSEHPRAEMFKRLSGTAKSIKLISESLVPALVSKGEDPDPLLRFVHRLGDDGEGVEDALSLWESLKVYVERIKLTEGAREVEREEIEPALEKSTAETWEFIKRRYRDTHLPTTLDDLVGGIGGSRSKFIKCRKELNELGMTERMARGGVVPSERYRIRIQYQKRTETVPKPH